MSFLGEIKRRKVFQVAAVYAVVAWLLIQVADVVLPAFEAPTWVLQVVIFLTILGFPLTLVISWAFDLTSRGVVRDHGSAGADKNNSRGIEYVLIGLLAMAVGWTLYRVESQSSVQSPESSFEVPDGILLPNSVAVLPFISLSPNPEDDFYADSIHIELIGLLQKIQDLTAISRDSVVQFRDTNLSRVEIAHRLRVGAILTGTVRYAGNRIAVDVNLLEPGSDVSKWSEMYSGDLTDIFEIQTEIATQIAAELQVQLLPSERDRLAIVPTESSEATTAYLAGKQLLAQRDETSLLGATTNFRIAVDRDPNFTSAWIGLAEAWVELPNYSQLVSSGSARAESLNAANKANQLDPDSPDALAVLGWHKLRYEYDWKEAERFFENALALQERNVNALHWYSHLLSWQGNHEAAIEKATQALEAGPLSTLMRTNLSYILADASKWDESFALGEEILSTDEYPSLMGNLWIANLRANRLRDAAIYLERWAMVAGRDIEAAEELSNEIIRLQGSGESTDQLDELILELRLPTSIPEIYAVLYDRDRTLAALEQAHLNLTGDRSLLSMKINPSYDFIRDDSRFIDMQDRINLTD